jgi:hypothetical protein
LYCIAITLSKLVQQDKMRGIFTLRACYGRFITTHSFA